MIAAISDEVSGRCITILFGMTVGAMSAWLVQRWRRFRERRSVLRGDARDTIVIAHHLVNEEVDPTSGERKAGTLRIRSQGQSELNRVVPNGHLASVLLHRALQVTSRQTLISMEGAEGSYLLETLTNFVCDRIGNAPFEHDLYVMVPCCEPADLAEHQPITLLLISVADLALFESWPLCRDVHVEHGADGARVLTLMEVAKRFRFEQDELARRRKAGERTRHVETMYILDLTLDKRSATIATRPVPWGRFETLLKEMNLE